jgi:AGZA family xanthine/uracil permease-like MFS transporter
VLNKIFKLDKNATTVTTELLAGLTTFITMAYILAVMPTILADTGMNKEAVFFTTCLGIGFVSIAMGIFANLPVALGPSLGLGAYFVAIVTQADGISWQTALGAVFVSGGILFILTAIRVRQILVDAIPSSLKHALTVGIGFFLTFIGLRMSHLVEVVTHVGPSLEAMSVSKGVAHLAFFEWNLNLSSFSNPDTLLVLIGLAITSVFVVLNVRGAVLLSIVISTLIGIPLGLTNIHDIHFGLPSWQNLNIGVLDIKGALNLGMFSVIFTFVFVGLMDTFGTLVSTTHKAGILDKPGSKRIIGRAMLVDSIGSCLGAFLGSPTLTEYLESIVGISAGGRTGLTAVTTGILFLLSLFLSSLFIIIPNAATAPALILLGAFMLSSVHNIDFKDFSEGMPAFLTIILMPLTYSIANGISAGITFYVLLKVVTGKWRIVHWLMYVLTALIVLRFVCFN